MKPTWTIWLLDPEGSWFAVWSGKSNRELRKAVRYATDKVLDGSDADGFKMTDNGARRFAPRKADRKVTP